MTKTKRPFRALADLAVVRGALLVANWKNLKKLVTDVIRVPQTQLATQEMPDLAKLDADKAKPVVMTAPQIVEKEKLEMRVERTSDDQVILGDFSVPAARLREVYFRRKGMNHFKVIAEVFNEGAAAFGRYAGATDTVVGIVDEKDVPELEKRLEKLKISSLNVSL